MSLTKRQREILTYLDIYSGERGYAPSFEEIAAQFNYNSLATVHEHLTNLERKGYIKRAYNESRGIEVLPSSVTPRAMSLPLLGTDGHVRPLEALEAETIRFAIDRYRGRMTEVARRLRIGRSTLYRKLKELGFDTGPESLELREEPTAVEVAAK